MTIVLADTDSNFRHRLKRRLERIAGVKVGGGIVGLGRSDRDDSEPQA